MHVTMTSLFDVTLLIIKVISYVSYYVLSNYQKNLIIFDNLLFSVAKTLTLG